MDLANISGIRTTDDLKAQAAGQTSELDRNAFLKLFTTQLQNQDPLDPVKNEAFIAQLAQFSTLEATTSMSDSLQEFVADQRGDGLMRGAALIGKSVFMENGVFEQPGGEKVEGYLQLNSGADDVVLNVVDTRSGQLVNQMSLGPQMAGEVPFTWNGVTLAARLQSPAVTHLSLRRFATAKAKQLIRSQLPGLPVSPGIRIPARHFWNSPVANPFC